MRKRSLVVSTGLMSSIVLTGCSDISTSLSDVSADNYLAHGFTDEAIDNGVYLVPEEFLIDCGSWSPYNLAFEDENSYPEVYYCTGNDEQNIFLYKGVIAFDLKTLTTSNYYLTGGTDKKDVFVADLYKKQNITPSYKNNSYTVALVEDPTARFNETISEEDAEGVLVTQSQLDNEQWSEDPNNPGVLTSSTGALLFAGVLFASMAAMNNSSYYKSKGSNTSKIAIPMSVKNGKDSLGYSNKNYFSNGNIKANNVATLPAADKNSNPLGVITSKKKDDSAGGSAVMAGTSSAMMKSTETIRGTTNSSKSNSSGTSTSRGSSGISSGAKGGGAS